MVFKGSLPLFNFPAKLHKFECSHTEAHNPTTRHYTHHHHYNVIVIITIFVVVIITIVIDIVIIN